MLTQAPRVATCAGKGAKVETNAMVSDPTRAVPRNLKLRRTVRGRPSSIRGFMPRSLRPRMEAVQRGRSRRSECKQNFSESSAPRKPRRAERRASIAARPSPTPDRRSAGLVPEERPRKTAVTRPERAPASAPGSVKHGPGRHQDPRSPADRGPDRPGSSERDADRLRLGPLQAKACEQATLQSKGVSGAGSRVGTSVACRSVGHDLNSC